MIDSILEWSLRNRLAVLALAFVLIGWGAWEAATMPVDVFPDLTAPSVSVVIDAHGMTPEDIEQTITFPVESALNGASGVRRVRSNTTKGIAVVNADFEWGVDLLNARQIVAERLQSVQNTLPPEADAPIMGPMTSVMGDIVFLGLTSESDDVSMMDLRTVADSILGRRLLAVEGVAQVIALGGDIKQYQVVLDARRLDAFGVTAAQVSHALVDANRNVPAGFLVEGHVEHVISGVGRIQSLEDVRTTRVAERGGVPIRVEDVATVQIGPAVARGSGGVSGEHGVVLGVRKQPDVNTLELTGEIDGVLDELERSLPEGMVLHRSLFRQADFIEVAVDNVAGALRDGALLVILIVLIFLGSGRATFITALAIPLSLLSAVLVMSWQGMSINTMTLGGMAIAVGALVDDAIIDVENITRRLRLAHESGSSESYLSIVYEASREIRRSITFATGIIILVFLPLFFLTGIEGRILQPLGYAYVVSLAASLMVALTVTPVLCLYLLPESKSIEETRDTWLVRKLKSAYGPLLQSVVDRWRLLAAFSAILLVVALIAASFAGRSFLPGFNEGALTINITTPPGTSLEDSTETARRVERIVLGQPGVLSTARRTGRASGDDHAQPVFSSELEVRLDRESGISQADMLRRLRRDLEALQGIGIVIGQPLEHRIEHLISGTRAAIAVKIFGPRLTELQRIAREVESEMKSIEGVVDLNVEQKTSVPFISVDFDRRQLARYGISMAEASDELAAMFYGKEVATLFEGSNTYHLVVRYERDDLEDLESLRSMRISTSTGARIPLSAVARIDRSIGPNTISRENVERKLVVMSNVADRDVGSVIADLRERLENVDTGEGHYIEIAGQFESAEAAARTIALVSAAVVFAIFILLIVAFASTRDAALVMLNLPLALVGGVAGIWIAGGVISVASLIGFITLFGVATRNGIMMVTHIQHLHAVEGVTDQRQAVVQGAMERLAPILMTALASGLGLLPLAMALGEPGSEIQAPMAIVILSGLSTSTALNMFVVPALYLRFGAFGPSPLETTST